MSSTEVGMCIAVKKDIDREACYAGLIAHANGQGNDHALACMYASWKTGGSALPSNWGLSPVEFGRLMEIHFPGADILSDSAEACSHTADRTDEQAELADLLMAHCAGISSTEKWIALIVAVACLGSDHLWQDLGLWNREELTALMQRNFPALATRNVGNMKWKKFLYKQLCAAEGVYICRAPSCEVCTDYDACFGPED